jgi:predicted MPP superfamily phosphohydrolase
MAVVIAGAINLNTIRLSEYFIKLPRKSSTLHHLKIAFISDIHLNNNSSAWFIEKFAGKLKEINPDIVLYGGDIVEGDHEKESTNSIEMAFNSIKVPFGSYGVYGNHEYHGQNNHDTLFKRIGICILRDSVIRFENMFYLAGRLDQEVINRKTIQQLIGRLPNDLPVILLDHRPTDMQNISRSMADLSFSGHTHHGQLFPINLITQKLYSLSWGYRKISNTHFFVTSGLRLWGPPVRTTGKSEIMVINIDFIPDIDIPGKN